MRKVEVLRKKYPKFIYEKYSWQISNKNLKIFFDFRMGNEIHFRPEIIIKNIDKERLLKIKTEALNNFIFHLGLMEIPSYWKTACSPEILIQAGQLNKNQIRWWKNLILKGLGQFFYENKINWKKPNFITITIEEKKKYSSVLFKGKLNDRYLVPMGGGRDSIVTLEKLRGRAKNMACFMVNPTEISKDVARIAYRRKIKKEKSRIGKPILVKRKIAPVLLELNKKGYLNGHTPFTALLSFLAVFCAVLFDYKNIAFSNEKSANEGNVKYLGENINHQWSKSSEFEKKFKKYCEKFLIKKINYFSFLRQWNEIEISKMFTLYPEYFSVFSSCNAFVKITPPFSKKRGKTKGRGKWCGECPKCLFVYLSLYPFMETKKIIKIFGEDIFQKKELLPVLKALIGKGKTKPFECVGSFGESQQALALCLKKAKKTGQIPYLLRAIFNLKP